MSIAENRQAILEGRTALGIELGSTRIKAVLINEQNEPIASGDMNGRIVMNMEYGPTVLRMYGAGFRGAIRSLLVDIKEKYGAETELTRTGAIGISAMMHGYMPF